MKAHLVRLAALGLMVPLGCQTPVSQSSLNHSVSGKSGALAGQRRAASSAAQHGVSPNSLGKSGYALPHGQQSGEAKSPSRGSPSRGSSDSTAQRSGSGSVATNLTKALTASREGRSQEARRYFRRVLEKQPNHPLAHHRLAVLADKRRDYGTAEQHYLAALQASPDNPDLLSDLGYSYLLQGRHEDSEAYLQRALQIDSSHQRALNNLGLLYGKQGQYEKAYAMFRQGGTEEQARANMAKLFPERSDAVATASSGQQGASPRTENRSPQPGRTMTAGMNGGEANAARFAEPQSGSQNTGGMSPTTRKLKRMMDQARREALAERQSRSQPSAGTPSQETVGSQSRHSRARFQVTASQGSAGGDLQNAEPRSSRTVSGEETAVGYHDSIPQNRNVPNHQMNDRIAQINASPGKRSVSSAERSRQRPQKSARQTSAIRQQPQSLPSTSNNNRSSAAKQDPLESMPVWPRRHESNRETNQGSGSIQSGSTGRGRPETRHVSSSQSSGQPRDRTSPQTPGGVRRASYEQSHGSVPQWPYTASSQQRSAVESAAYLGMNAGPGQPFPTMEGRSRQQSGPSRLRTGSGSQQSATSPRRVQPQPRWQNLPTDSGSNSGSSGQRRSASQVPRRNSGGRATSTPSNRVDSRRQRRSASSRSGQNFTENSRGQQSAYSQRSFPDSPEINPRRPRGSASRQGDPSAQGSRSSGQNADPLEAYQRQIRQHNQQYDAMREELSRERRLPNGGGRDRPELTPPSYQMRQ